MEKIDTLLFDFDGVVADTESQYTRFWTQTAIKYAAGGVELAVRIKGTPLMKILETHFAHTSAAEREDIVKALGDFEKGLNFNPICGVVDFVKAARERGFKTAIVTSSTAAKMRHVFAQTQYAKLFDTLVTGEDISRGKPDPMCFLKGAQKLGAKIENCAVFEDSLTGLKAARAAKMFTVGLLTTFPKAEVEALCDISIPDFADSQKLFQILSRKY